jgi:hypothetical protein
MGEPASLGHRCWTCTVTPATSIAFSWPREELRVPCLVTSNAPVERAEASTHPERLT